MTTKSFFARFLIVPGAIIVLALVPLQARASQCSTSAEAGTWAYTYTGTIFTHNGPIPAASVGRFPQDAAGNVMGSQARSVAVIPGLEDVSGTVSVNKDCAATRDNQLVSLTLERVYPNTGW